MCRVCGCYRGRMVVMDVFWRRLCVSMSEVGKSLFNAANVLWRCAQYFLLPLVASCLETIDVCIWRMLIYVSVVVTVWGSVGMFVV